VLVFILIASLVTGELLMLFESSLSALVVLLVAARAVNIFK
jgi:hypothetical protein